MMYWRERNSWIVAGAALVLGIAGAFVASLGWLGSRDDGTPSASTAAATPSQVDAASGAADAVEVYSNVVQSGGEIEGGSSATGVAAIANCDETTSAHDWYLTDPYPQGATVAESASSRLMSFNSAYDTGSGYVLDAHMAPGDSLSFTYDFDACRPFTIETWGEAGNTVLTIEGPDGVAFGTELEPSPAGADVEVTDAGTTVTYAPPTAGTWTVTVTFTGGREADFKLTIDQPGSSETNPIAVCEVTVNGDSATLDASNSYDPDGDPVTAYWWDFAQENELEDGSKVDLSGMREGWYEVYCVVGEEPLESSWVGVEVWVGSDRPVIGPPSTPVTFEAEGLGRDPDIACSVTVGPGGLDYVMPESDAQGEKFTEWSWDLPFGQESTDLRGHIAIPEDVGILHFASCHGTTADGTTYVAGVDITLQ